MAGMAFLARVLDDQYGCVASLDQSRSVKMLRIVCESNEENAQFSPLIHLFQS